MTTATSTTSKSATRRVSRTPEKRAAEVEALAEQLNAAVAELTTSEAWVAMLRVAARFTTTERGLDVPTRLARAIVALVEGDGWGWTGDGRRQDCRLARITQGDLAAHVGATRESINKWLGYYERRGYIRRERDSIVVLRLDELRSRARVE